MTSLADLQVGGESRVVSIHGADEITTRLFEMGLTPGVVVRLRSVAPLGDPMEFEVRGYRLSLRRSEAARVSVEKS